GFRGNIGNQNLNPNQNFPPPNGPNFQNQNMNANPDSYSMMMNNQNRQMRMIADQPMGTDTDSMIIQKIRERLNNDAYLSESSKNIQITATDGYVGLRGTVHSNEEKSRIGSIAKNINGVKDVGNNLRVE